MTPRGVVAIAGNKGGIGKTTLAVNLAVWLRTLHPELPVLLLGLDDQDVIDRMFGEEGEPPGPDLGDALRTGALDAAIRLGRFGVHWVPTCAHISELKREIETPGGLADLLASIDWPGIVLIDTKADLEELTQNALWASDLTLLPVSDQTSLREAEKVFQRFDTWGRARERARVVLSLVDLRIKYAGAEHGDVLALLLSQIRGARWPLFESFLSRSPRIEALQTNAEGRPMPVREQAPRSLVNEQLRHITQELLRTLAADDFVRSERRATRRRAYPKPLVAFMEDGAGLVELLARDLSAGGLGTAASLRAAIGSRLHVAFPDAEGRPALFWARVVRDAPTGALRFEDGPTPAVAAALDALVPGRSPEDRATEEGLVGGSPA
jgi:cellulose biosynthesis protein BcsQ